MEKIYSLEEPGLPRFRVEVSDVRPILFFETVMQGSPGRAGEHTCRALDRGEVQRLHNALGEWLYPQNLGPTPGDYAAAVKALGDAVNGLATSVRPLWSAPAAVACRCHDNEGNSVLPDPEPRDVGHPEPEPLCTRSAPEDAHPVSRCTFCGHLWSDHADPTPLERVRAFYRSTLSPAAVVPECGLCKQPWNDTHGQPENPCAGAPKQLVGCECGHSWRAHDETGCGRVHGVGSGCTRIPPSAPQVKCTCAHPRQVHGPYGCGYLGECACEYGVPAETSALRAECDECGHRWAVHPPAFGVSYCVQSTNGVPCGCKVSAP